MEKQLLLTKLYFKKVKSKCKKCVGSKLCYKHKKLYKLIGIKLNDVDPKLIK